jgi:glycerol-3-phosphate O-acyltransferase
LGIGALGRYYLQVKKNLQVKKQKAEEDKEIHGMYDNLQQIVKNYINKDINKDILTDITDKKTINYGEFKKLILVFHPDKIIRYFPKLLDSLGDLEKDTVKEEINKLLTLVSCRLNKLNEIRIKEKEEEELNKAFGKRMMSKKSRKSRKKSRKSRKKSRKSRKKSRKSRKKSIPYHI